MSSSWLLLAYANLALATSCLALFIYRIYFHPLAKVPGPLSNKFTGWPHHIATAAGRRYLYPHSLHQIYGKLLSSLNGIIIQPPGPVVRISPSKVSFNTSTALHTIYGNRRAPVAKGHFYTTIRASGHNTATTFSTANEVQYTFKRRILSCAFSEKAIQDYEQHVSANIDKWLDCLGAGPVDNEGWTKEGKNVSQWINYLTMDILTDLAYGKSFNLLGKEDMRS
jgi:hypothetical protein